MISINNYFMWVMLIFYCTISRRLFKFLYKARILKLKSILIIICFIISYICNSFNSLKVKLYIFFLTYIFHIQRMRLQNGASFGRNLQTTWISLCTLLWCSTFQPRKVFGRRGRTSNIFAFADRTLRHRRRHSAKVK